MDDIKGKYNFDNECDDTISDEAIAFVDITEDIYLEND